uniref:Phospho-N-acetylmuramoyl-pentapeptide-transferase n=1 Tax=Lygus hesperus TaxID=30085 RepID=A0A0A9Y187_LYGHE
MDTLTRRITVVSCWNTVNDDCIVSTTTAVIVYLFTLFIVISTNMWWGRQNRLQHCGIVKQLNKDLQIILVTSAVILAFNTITATVTSSSSTAIMLGSGSGSTIVMQALRHELQNIVLVYIAHPKGRSIFELEKRQTSTYKCVFNTVV